MQTLFIIRLYIETLFLFVLIYIFAPVVLLVSSITSALRNIKPVQPQLTTLPQIAVDSICQCIFDVLFEIADGIAVNKPTSSYDLRYISVNRMGIPMIDLSVIKKNNGALEKDEILRIKLLLDAKVSSRIAAWAVPNIPIRSIDGIMPVVKIFDVVDRGKCIVITVAWASTTEICQKIREYEMKQEDSGVIVDEF